MHIGSILAAAAGFAAASTFAPIREQYGGGLFGSPITSGYDITAIYVAIAAGIVMELVIRITKLKL